MSLVSMLHPSSLAVDGIILTVWSITPLSWVYVGVSIARYFGHTVPLVPPIPAFVHYPLLFWSAVELVFSLYYLYLARRLQAKGPAPVYGRRFLRQVFARALESGMDDVEYNGTEKDEQAVATATGATRSDHAGTLRQRGGQQGSPLNPLATKRLRAASLLPRFVDKEPLDKDDPRARAFAEAQAMWFPGSSVEDITRRDAERWLAWSLYGAELDDVEAERQRSPITTKDTAAKNGSDKAHLTVSALSALRGEISSPVPPPRGSFASQVYDSEDDEEEDLEGPFDLQKEDKRGVRAAPGEWDADPVRGDRLEFLHYCRELIEARQGFAFPLETKDWKPLPCMRLTIDPVVIASRPLALYLITNALTSFTIWHAQRQGFKLEKLGRLRYLIFKPDGWTSAKAESDPRYRPIVFLHGLGIGLAQYGAFVRHLTRTGLTSTHPLLIPLSPHTSQAIFDPGHINPMMHHESTAHLRRVFKKQGWMRCGVTVISHSMGTCVHAWLLKSAGDFVRRSCIVDPVCFQLWVPHIISNFLYKRPDSPVMRVISYFVAREPGTAHTLQRHFDWSSCLLWPQDEIPNLHDPHHVQIYLAEDDVIVAASETRRYLRQFGMKEQSDVGPGQGYNLTFVKGAAHGEVLMAGGAIMKNIVSWLDEAGS